MSEAVSLETDALTLEEIRSRMEQIVGVPLFVDNPRAITVGHFEFSPRRLSYLPASTYHLGSPVVARFDPWLNTPVNLPRPLSLYTGGWDSVTTAEALEGARRELEPYTEYIRDLQNEVFPGPMSRMFPGYKPAEHAAVKHVPSSDPFVRVGEELAATAEAWRIAKALGVGNGEK